jgi:hypothetical protein
MSRGHVPVLRILSLEGETRGSTISAATATVTSLTFAVYAGRCDCLFAPSASSRSERQRRRPQVRRPSRRPDRARGTGSLGRAVRSAADTVRDSERPGVGRTRVATRATSCESSGHVRGRSTGRHRSVRRTCTGTSRSRSTAVGPRFVRSRPRRGAADPRADSVSDRTAFARRSRGCLRNSSFAGPSFGDCSEVRCAECSTSSSRLGPTPRARLPCCVQHGAQRAGPPADARPRPRQWHGRADGRPRAALAVCRGDRRRHVTRHGGGGEASAPSRPPRSGAVRMLTSVTRSKSPSGNGSADASATCVPDE